jgi:endonuclease/exonuclease/phosphatase family metal-dependent hydrolase
MPARMRVATFNVRHCEGMDGVVDVERVAAVMRATEADLIALQELDRGLPRSGGEDQPRALGEATGMHVAFHPTLERRRGDYGIAIATFDRIEVAFEALPRAGDEEPRGVLAARYRGLDVLATHLTRDRAARPLQLDALARMAVERGPLVVVLGDLNVEPARLGPLERSGLSGCEGLPTLPAPRPRRQIDHVLGGVEVTITDCKTIATDASDHRPLIADLRYEP